MPKQMDVLCDVAQSLFLVNSQPDKDFYAVAPADLPQALANGVEKGAHHSEFHVGFQEGGAYFLKGFVKVGVAQTSPGS